MTRKTVDQDIIEIETHFMRRYPGAACVLRPIEALQGELLGDERVYAKGVGLRRRREFIAGRTAGRIALQKLGIPATSIPRGERGNPHWPSGVVGSLSHTESHCFCLVAEEKRFRSVGVDMETVNRMRMTLAYRVLTDGERKALSGLPLSRFLLYAAVLFSAKEAFFKFQFPFTRRTLGFRDVAFHLLVKENRVEGKTRIPQWPEIEGIFRFWRKWVITVIAV